MSDTLFDDLPQAPTAVLMSLDPQYYELFWRGEKQHEFRRRFLRGQAVTWYVYLTAPAARLAPVIELDPAIIDTPKRIAAIAEAVRPGNGASVRDYLARDGHDHGFALPVRAIREYAGFSREELADMHGGFHPPQGYTLINRHPDLAAVCDKLTGTGLLREMTIEHPSASR